MPYLIRNIISVCFWLNLVSFVLMRLDKFLACNLYRRTPEAVLCFFTFFGPLGTLIAMIFPFFNGRHKCRKVKFWVFTLLGFLFNAAAIYYILYH